jgi:DNA-binding transcriptional LysR family regulator
LGVKLNRLRICKHLEGDSQDALTETEGYKETVKEGLGVAFIPRCCLRDEKAFLLQTRDSPFTLTLSIK